MRVFVTGATGYIGFAVCKAVQKRRHDVVGLARTSAAIDKLRAAGIHPVHGRLGDADVLREMTHDADAVVHCGFEQSGEGVALDAGALDAMLATIDSGHEAFVYTSGVWLYGNTGPTAVDETAPLDPTPIVAWRPAHEKKVLDARKHTLRTIVIRPGLVYGDGGGIVGMMMGQAKAGQLVTAGSGENHWATVRVDALAELYALAIERAPAGSIYNGVNGAPVTYGEVARAASRSAGGDGEVPAIPLERAREMMGAFADALALDQIVSGAKAVRELEWDPDRPTVLEELAATTVA